MGMKMPRKSVAICDSSFLSKMGRKMRKKSVSYEWFSYICILSQIRRKARVMTNFLRKKVSKILNFLVVYE
ncbi:hypothetical protein Hanom_Chr00s063060g01785951 [Helianthus anomalus]